MATKKRRQTRTRTAAASPRRRDPVRIADQLSGIVRKLRLATSATMVCVEALRRQNADLDADIARVLARDVGDRLHSQVEKLQRLAASLR